MLDLFTSIIFFVYLFFLRGEEPAIQVALTIFIAFSPVCLMLSKILVIRLAERVAEEEEIKLNNPDSLLTLAEVDTVAVPMNKFVTDGNYFVTDLFPEGLTQSSLLSFCAIAEQNASHILGQKIYDAAVNRALRLQPVAAFNEIPGSGVEAILNGSPIRVGNPQWVANQGVSVSVNLFNKMDQLAVHGKTVLLLGMGNMARGIIALKDDINPRTKEFLSMLKRKKLETVLLTASGKKTAKGIAKNLSVDAIKANLSPEDKAREVQIMRAKRQTVAVIGNEFRDLPALFNADVAVHLQDGSLVLNEGSDNLKLDIEIPSPEKFLIIRNIATKAADLIKINRRIAYVSWLLLVPAAMMTAPETSTLIFTPLMAFAGVAIFSTLIAINSMRMRKPEEEKF